MRGWHHYILEPQLFLCLDFFVWAENKEQALRKIQAACDRRVKQTESAFEGLEDQAEMVRWTKEYWETGMMNRSYLGENKPDKSAYCIIL